MRTDTFAELTNNFALDTRIDVKLSWLSDPKDSVEADARKGFLKDLQELADFINSTLGKELLTMWESVQRAKAANGN